ncbi:serine/threonine-protein kinase [Roseicyclus persicicus]|uniref:Serine/threonine protein kinase n=1 Tax=Roseicyclus persicicus TaxID=2650661 RepID=A0A7X6JYG0_9RHOB|nr:serine/threonine-protein kinase [Roseibacterium persicicum]NKX44429.1 serine/threonine protein kinase [Roseibacterium persicicum]
MDSARTDRRGDELPPGSTLCGGQYTIDGYLNAGGFGVTYLAGDSLGRRVVIKECFPGAVCYRDNAQVWPRSRSTGGEFETILGLFEKEAQALAALQHPYIVGVHQYFRENGTAYMAMDFIEGRTLLDVIETEPHRLTPDEVKQLLIRLLQAVQYIHEHDILHRDISPDNILIDRDNLPVLIDFGAAREGATRVSRVLSKVLTVKDGYSPQEFYLAGSDQVRSSDLYALAATFYHVVGGQPPPSSHKRMAAVARNLADPLRPLEGVAGYDAHFIDAINQCLSIFPQQRLPSAAAWRDVIDRERRIKRALEQAARDEELDRRIRALVAEFRRDFVPVAPPAPAPAAAPTPPPTARPEPDTAGPAASDEVVAIDLAEAAAAEAPGPADDPADAPAAPAAPAKRPRGRLFSRIIRRRTGAAAQDTSWRTS